MTLFQPLYVRRSDGKLEVSNKRQVEKNQPLPKQLDRTPDAKGVCDYYREISENDPKHLDWRRKLAGMLMRELGGVGYQGTSCNPSLQLHSLTFFEDKAYILAALPENYRLFEHIKSKAEDAEGRPQKSAKNHAGGGHDRQDAYLYGHPMGRKKRYRSPADFFPHLLWLVTDETGDTRSCSCKACSPEELQPEDKPAVKEVKQAAQVKKEEAQIKPQVSGKHPVVEIPRRQPSQDSLATKQPPTPMSLPQRTTTPQTTQTPNAQPQPSPLPPPRSLDQQIDASYDRFLFRPGEIVWFNRGQAWGLGVITRRYALNPSTAQEIRAYVVQPLSHPFAHPPQVVITRNDHLRPWLAWSPPPFTNGRLNERNVTYDAADWAGILDKRYGVGDAEVDGSILAARAVDASYTLFDLTRKSRADAGAGAEERHWNGMFLGAEKIWVGEPVRLRPGSGTDVLVVLDIVERIQPVPVPVATPTPGAPGIQQRTTVHVTGDIYTLLTNLRNQTTTPTNRHLPLRMREDLRARNALTKPVTPTSAAWKLLQPAVRFDLSQIKGRWYEASLLLPLLDAAFEQHVQQGEVGDAGLYMNARGDATETKDAGVRQPERRDALGRAVPPLTRLVDGIEAPSPREMGVEGQGPEQGGQQEPVMPEGALEEFMNLDGMEHEGVPGFGGEFPAQDGGNGPMYF